MLERPEPLEPEEEDAPGGHLAAKNMAPGYTKLEAAEKYGRLQAQSRSLIRNVLHRLGQRPDLDLLSFDQVRNLLRSPLGIDRGMQIIPIASIVGSVGRYHDFDRAFLPLSGADEQRWRELDVALNQLRTLPPIDVYKVGEVYFVRDGNHRVSVAKANGLTHIDAYVTEIQPRVPLTADIDAEKLIIMEEYAQFLEETHLDESRPEARLEFSVLGHYEILLEHIQVHGYYLGLGLQRDVSFREAAADWYDTVYIPVVETIREAAVLQDFPGRTETDLYLWVAYHRERLSLQYGVPVPTREVLDGLAHDFSQRGFFRFARGVRRAVRAAIEAATESPAPPDLPGTGHLPIPPETSAGEIPAAPAP
jgi:hypothetical protein